MIGMALSAAASGLLRALLARAGSDPNRILLIKCRSIDWQSLTFIGERHHIRLRVSGPDAETLVGRLTGGLENAEFTIPGHIVADIVSVGQPQRDGDGSISVEFEALTIAA